METRIPPKVDYHPAFQFEHVTPGDLEEQTNEGLHALLPPFVPPPSPPPSPPLLSDEQPDLIQAQQNLLNEIRTRLIPPMWEEDVGEHWEEEIDLKNYFNNASEIVERVGQVFPTLERPNHSFYNCI